MGVPPGVTLGDRGISRMTASRRFRDQSSSAWTTASDKKHPPSPGPTSPRASSGSHPARSRPDSQNQSAESGSPAAAPRGSSSPGPTRCPTTPNYESSSSSTPVTQQHCDAYLDHRRHARDEQE